MRKTLILSLCLALLCGLALGGCGSETPKKDLQYNTAYPLGTAEYQMTVNQKLVPLISSLQPLANAEAFSHTDLESAVAKIADMSEKLAVLNPPKDKAVYHAELLAALQTASDWLETQYENTADASDRDFSVILKSIEDAFRVSVN